MYVWKYDDYDGLVLWEIAQPYGCVFFCMYWYVRWCVGGWVCVCAVWLLCEVKVIMLSLCKPQSNHNLDGAYSSS